MDYLVYALVLNLLVFAPLTAWLATQKNRSAVEGAIVGAVFGIIGLAVIGLAPAPAERTRLSTTSLVLMVAILALIVWVALGMPGL